MPPLGPASRPRRPMVRGVSMCTCSLSPEAMGAHTLERVRWAALPGGCRPALAPHLACQPRHHLINRRQHQLSWRKGRWVRLGAPGDLAKQPLEPTPCLSLTSLALEPLLNQRAVALPLVLPGLVALADLVLAKEARGRRRMWRCRCRKVSTAWPSSAGSLTQEAHGSRQNSGRPIDAFQRIAAPARPQPHAARFGASRSVQRRCVGA